jgi:HTH-type transcriptional regulator / antitoxin HigA
MTRGTNGFDPDYQASPGDILSDYLSDLGMSQAELARRTGLSVKHINQISQGQATITAGTAVLLGHATGIDARIWSRLESSYQVARGKVDEATRLEGDVSWLANFPIAELKKRNFLSSTARGVGQLRELLDFFRVATPSAWDQVWATPTAYRLSQSFDPNYGALAAWIRIGELRAVERPELPPFERERFRQQLPSIRRLTQLEDPNTAIPQLIELCAQVGVSLVVEPEIKGSRINGVVRWLPTGNPLIILSMRHRWADIFWFTFFHEAGHLLLHERKKLTFVDAPKSGTGSSVTEAEADEFASQTLIPREFDREVLSALNADDVNDLASRVGVHAGIIVGRMQHEGVVRFSQLNDLRTRFEPTYE